MLESVSSPFQIPAQNAIEILQVHQMAQDFRREVECREQFAAYCDWYDRTALQHQQEWAAMQKDVQLRGYFRRNRS
ncbi:hypothetical protein [Pseudanabaena sp. FACHB-2040]|uniref:hypothetical protein n=1 Tax=Pseudanabaena sp. FACHB-2040 TaxID=2692859 RepID=UPI0018EFFF53|nr:hypothetical protein [Pseudanabaena sp. FACHB-2040]